MSLRLAIRLGEAPHERVSWMRWTEGETRVESFEGTLRDAAQAAHGAFVIVLAPGAAIYLSSVSLAIRNRAQLRTALAYALEEELAAAVESLHFAVGRRDAAGRTPVAAVERRLLEHWLRLLEEAGIRPALLLPETVALPWRAGQWTLLIDDRRLLLRNGEFSGFGGDAENLSALMAAQWESVADAPPMQPTELLVCDGRSDVEAEARPLPALLHPLECSVDAAGALTAIHPALGEPLTVRAARASDDSTSPPFPSAGVTDDLNGELNFLRGEYGSADRLQRGWRPWRIATLLAALWIGLHLGATALEIGRLEGQIAVRDQEIAQLYRAAFPDAERLVNVRAQTEQQLQTLRARKAGEANDFLEWLERIGPALRTPPSNRLLRIRYRPERLEFALEAERLEALEGIRDQLEGRQQLQVEMSASAGESGRAEGRLTVETTP